LGWRRLRQAQTTIAAGGPTLLEEAIIPFVVTILQTRTKPLPLPGYQYRHNDRFQTDNGEFLSTMCISATGSTDWRLRR
jgi:hypothetical protein